MSDMVVVSRYKKRGGVNVSGYRRKKRKRGKRVVLERTAPTRLRRDPSTGFILGRSRFS
jgi:hypothetical protein